MIEKMLVLSTKHIASSVPDFGLIRHSSHDYGWICFIHSESRQQSPDWMRKIVKHALKKKCNLIMFDRDADTSSRFKEYDW